VVIRDKYGYTPAAYNAMANILARTKSMSASDVAVAFEEILGNLAAHSVPEEDQPVNKTAWRAAVTKELMLLEKLVYPMLTGEHQYILSFDGHSSDQRHFVSVGLFASETVHLPRYLIETGHSAAAELVDEVKNLFARIQHKQEIVGVPPEKRLQLYHIVSLSADNTSSNTGQYNGVAAQLDKERAAAWKEQGHTSGFEPLIFKGCNDHIQDLII